MKKVLRVLGQVLAVVVITLALDYILLATVFADMKRHWADAATALVQSYITTDYHHDLAPNMKSDRAWGNIVYPWQTDRYGFRIGACAPGDADKNKQAIFVIGDSFVEAIGSTYEKSFTGLMACDAAKQGKAVWNLGVASYSPTIYWRKIRHAAQQLGLKPAEIYVFLDLSDIGDDANIYHVGEDGVVRSTAFHWYNIGQFLLDNFATFRLGYDLYVNTPFSTSIGLGRERAMWSLDPVLMDEWGRRGLEIAGRNLDKIVAMCREWDCRMTLVVYPWPESVAAGDRDGVQVRHWRDWAAQRHVRFIDGFAPFFREPAGVALRKYFIAGDVHFSELGHRLLFEELRTEIGDY
ncbi:MAG TPA: SGNH/GDSL hydrolase family protein [Reyranella sp.]|jgi:hypothetical protein|nr:SGNH/GDSL hydrolase family protein [Reyranella sp.]